LCEVEIGSGAVADGHGLAKLALGVEAVKDDAVNDDGKNLDNYFNNAADKGPILLEIVSRRSRIGEG
jgi:hypothetical protein